MQLEMIMLTFITESLIVNVDTVYTKVGKSNMSNNGSITFQLISVLFFSIPAFFFVFLFFSFSFFFVFDNEEIHHKIGTNPPPNKQLAFQ